MPQPSEKFEPNKVLFAVGVAAILLGIAGFIIVASISFSFWLIVPIVLLVFGIVAVTKSVYDHIKSRITQEKNELYKEFEESPEEKQGLKDAEAASKKLSDILKANGFCFDKAGAGIRIVQNKLDRKVFFLKYELIADLYSNFEKTSAQEAEFKRGEQMIRQLLPNHISEFSAISIQGIMALDNNIRLFESLETASSELFTQAVSAFTGAQTVHLQKSSNTYEKTDPS